MYLVGTVTLSKVVEKGMGRKKNIINARLSDLKKCIRFLLMETKHLDPVISIR